MDRARNFKKCIDEDITRKENDKKYLQTPIDDKKIKSKKSSKPVSKNQKLISELFKK